MKSVLNEKLDRKWVEASQRIADLERQLVHVSAEVVHRSAELTGAFHQLAAVVRQRDELLAAAKLFRSYCSLAVTDADGYAEAVAAIAKVQP